MLETLETLESTNPQLRRPYKNTAFAASTYNLGPATICWPHRDSSNRVCNPCANGPFGPYDWRRGGHLIIHEARLVIQLRPGDIMLFPSALVTHGNIPIQPGELRFSFTAYSAGGLERWIQQGFMTEEEWEATKPDAAAAFHAAAPIRLAEAFSQFQTIEELRQRYKQPGETSLYSSSPALTFDYHGPASGRHSRSDLRQVALPGWHGLLNAPGSTPPSPPHMPQAHPMLLMSLL